MFSCIFFCVPVISPQKTAARIELTFSSPPAAIDVSESFPLEVTVSGADQNAEYYLRGVFYKPDTTQYFGFTQNNQGEWHTNSNEVIKYFKVQGNGTATISFKPDITAAQYQPNQQYSFKIGRYTPAGSLTWSEQSSNITITQQATETPTPLLSPTNILSPSPTITPPPFEIGQLLLSEIMACPNPGEQEWVELYNSSSTETVLIDDFKMSDNSQHVVSISGQLTPLSYKVITINSSLFNNSGDSVKLFSSQGNEIDSMSYEDCIESSSLIKKDQQWQYTTSITKEQPNIFTAISIPTSLTTSPKPSMTPKLTATLEKNDDEERKTPAPDTQQKAYQYVEKITEFPTIASFSATTTTTPTTSAVVGVDAVQLEQKQSFPQNQKTPFILAGSSYILCAAVIAQKWYNLLSA